MKGEQKEWIGTLLLVIIKANTLIMCDFEISVSDNTWTIKN